jgi:hypothetical protein
VCATIECARSDAAIRRDLHFLDVKLEGGAEDLSRVYALDGVPRIPARQFGDDESGESVDEIDRLGPGSDRDSTSSPSRE